MPLTALTAPGVNGLVPYEPGKPIEDLERELGITGSIKLASNENPLGPGPAALQVIQTTAGQIFRYPDGGCTELRGALAELHAVEPDAITVGNGSNELLELMARTFLTPAHESLFFEHAFAVYPIVTQACGATARIVPISSADHEGPYGQDLKQLLEVVNEKTRLVFIANPNNPTGTWIKADQINSFMADVPEHVVVVIDEAYFEYVQEAQYQTAIPLIREYSNLLVTRTFSKIFGLAGLRIGYGIASQPLTELINRVRQPFNVNLLAQKAAVAALYDRHHTDLSVKTNQEGLEQLEKGIDALGLDSIPSVGNFLCINFSRQAQPIYDALLREGVIVRPVTNYGLPNHLRVTVGTQAENSRFLDTLKKVLA